MYKKKTNVNYFVTDQNSFSSKWHVNRCKVHSETYFHNKIDTSSIIKSEWQNIANL